MNNDSYLFFSNRNGVSLSSYLVALTRTSDAMSDRSSHLHLVPYNREKAFHIQLLNTVFLVGLSTHLWEDKGFYYKWMLNFIKSFFYIY